MIVCMKNSFLLVLLLAGISNPLQAQEEIFRERTLKSGIVIKATPLPFLFETIVGGSIGVKEDGLLFAPWPCIDKDIKYSTVFPCNSYLIKEMSLRFDDISKIRRRNYLFLFPNRIYVRKTNGENYLFITYRRKVIIDAFNNYKTKKNL